MAAFDVSVILKLIDQFTGPSRQAARAMTDLQRKMQAAVSAARAFQNMRVSANPFIRAVGQMGRAVTELQIRVRKAMSGIRADFERLGTMGNRLNEMRWQMVTTAFFAAPLAIPFRNYANYEMSLVRAGQIAQWDQDSFYDTLRERSKMIRDIARETSQYATDLVHVYSELVASGVPEPEALKGLRDLGKIMTATGTTAEDAAKLAFGLRKQFDVGPEQWMEVIGAAHIRGKMGAFELADMAQWFPILGGSMKLLGMGGLQGAKDLSGFLQIARETAGDPNMAANNLWNVFQKMSQKETRKNFEKSLGVDLAQELDRANKAGVSPLLHFMGLVKRYVDEVKEGNKFYVGDLVADMQALLGTAAFLNKTPAEIKALLEEITAKRAQEEINRDFETSTEALAFAWRQVVISLGDLNEALVGPVGGAARDTLKWIQGWVDSIKELAATYPHMTELVLKWGAAFIAAALGLRMILFLLGSFGYAALFIVNVAKALFRLLGALKALRAGGLFASIAKGVAALAAAFTGGLLVGVRSVAAALGLVSKGLLRLALGPVGLGIAAAWAAWDLLPEEWKQRQIEAVPSFLEEVKATFDSYAASIGQALGSLFGVPTPGYATPGQVPLLPQGGFGADIRSLFGRLSTPGQTIPSITDSGDAASATSITNNNQQSNISMPITINVTQTNASPGAIAGAVQGAGQSVASEVKKAMGDGGQ